MTKKTKTNLRSPPYSPTDDEKRLALRHIWYEIYEGVEAGGRLMSIPFKPEPIGGTLRNAAILAAHVHWRILAEFFSNDPEKDNVLASHYGSSIAALSLDPKVVTKINKTIAHLTYHRTTLTQPEWTYKIEDIGQPVLERCALFILHLLDQTNYVPDEAPASSPPWQQRAQWEALCGAIVIALQQIEARQERKPGRPPFSSTLPRNVRIIPSRHPLEPEAVAIEGTTTSARISPLDSHSS